MNRDLYTIHTDRPPSPYLTEPAFSARPLLFDRRLFFFARPRLFRPTANLIHTKEKPAGV